MHPQRWRLMTWVVLIWIVLTLLSAFRYALRDQACVEGDPLRESQCHLEARAGFRASVGWLVGGTIVLGTIWVLTQPRSPRPSDGIPAE